MRNILITVVGAVSLATTAYAGNNKDKSASNASADKSVSGDVQAVDVPAMAITLVSPAGDVHHIILAPDVSVTRNGSSSSLDQVQPGDNVRASYDSNSTKASSIDVKSKDKKDSQK
jgi:hypothetical protein